ncbi:MAG: peptidylprolyl isomerase [Clostridia bacterium]|nr:peptidylprolyl isomerase [Clostridia bacterium]
MSKEKDMYDLIKPENEAIKEEKETVSKKKEKVTKESNEPKISKINSDTKVVIGIISGMILVCAALIFYYFWGINKQVVASYKGGEVTRGEYEIYYKLFEPMLTYYGYEEDAIKTEVLNKIIIDKVVIKKAKEAKVKITDEQKSEVDELFKDKDEVAQYVEKGIDPDKMKQIYYDDALINAYIEKITSEAKEEDIKQFIIDAEGDKANYNKYNTSYILYGKDKDASKEDLKKLKDTATATLERIEKGEGFASVGQEVSEADETIQYGEEYSVYLNGTSVPSFEEALRKMKTGELTEEVVESEEYGYFIIKINSIEENARLNSEDAASNYVNELLANMQKDAKIKPNTKKLDSVVASLSK